MSDNSLTYWNSIPTCIVLVPVVPEAVEPIPTRERVGTVTVVVDSVAALPPRY